MASRMTFGNSTDMVWYVHVVSQSASDREKEVQTCSLFAMQRGDAVRLQLLSEDMAGTEPQSPKATQLIMDYNRILFKDKDFVIPDAYMEIQSGSYKPGDIVERWEPGIVFNMEKLIRA